MQQIAEALAFARAQLQHLHDQLEGDLASPAVQQFKANLKAEVDRLETIAGQAGEWILTEVESRVAAAVPKPAPPVPTQAQSTGKPNPEGPAVEIPKPAGAPAAVVEQQPDVKALEEEKPNPPAA